MKTKKKTQNIHDNLSRCNGIGPFLYIRNPNRFSHVAPELFPGFLMCTVTLVWITVSVILHVEWWANTVADAQTQTHQASLRQHGPLVCYICRTVFCLFCPCWSSISIWVLKRISLKCAGIVKMHVVCRNTPREEQRRWAKEMSKESKLCIVV